MQNILWNKLFFQKAFLIGMLVTVNASCLGYGTKYNTHIKEEFLNSYGLAEQSKGFEKLYDPSKPLEMIKLFFTLREIKNPEQTDRQAGELAFKASAVDRPQFKKMISTHAVDKLTIVQGEKDEKKNHFISKIIANDRNESLLKTVVGKSSFIQLITQPINSSKIIKERQSLIKALVEDKKLLNKCSEQLEIFKQAESSLLEFFKPQDDVKKELINKLYFKLGFMNSSSKMLGFFTRISYIMRSLVVALYTGALGAINLVPPQNFNIPEGKALIVRAFYSPFLLFTDLFIISDMRMNSLIMNYLQKQLINVSQCMRAAEKLALLLEDKAIPENLENLLIRSEKYPKNDQCQRLVDALFTNTFASSTSSIFSHLGRILSTYKVMENADAIKELNLMLNAVGELDAYVCIAKKIKECKDAPVHYSFVNFIEEQKTPVIIGTKAWNPFVPTNKAVPNDFKLSKESGQNFIMTGPNKGGKSTFMKQVWLNLLLAHTFGIAAADSFSCTPFKLLLAHLNENDAAGAGVSHFQSQCIKAKELLNKARSLKDGEFSFALLDEIFSGTSPEQEINESYKFISALNNTSNCSFIVATHHHKLTELERDTKGNCVNTHMGALTDESGTVLKYTYDLRQGFSTVKNAGQVAKDTGIDFEI